MKIYKIGFGSVWHCWEKDKVSIGEIMDEHIRYCREIGLDWDYKNRKEDLSGYISWYREFQTYLRELYPEFK